MYLQELFEDESLQKTGARFYPDITKDGYLLIRRSGTIAYNKAYRKVVDKFPPIELTPKEDILSRSIEIDQHVMYEYLIADMVGYKDSETGADFKFNKGNLAKFVFGDSGVNLVKGVFEFSSTHENYMLSRCKDVIDDINKYIKKFCFGDLKDELAREQLYKMSPEAYKKHMVGVKDENKEILSVFFDLCRERKENEFLGHSLICEHVMMNIINTDFKDAVYIIKQVDDNYIKLRHEKNAEAMEAQSDN